MNALLALRAAVREHLRVLAWLGFYAALVLFCFAVWFGVYRLVLFVLMLGRWYGWPVYAALAVAVLAAYEVLRPLPEMDEPWVLLEDEPGCGLEDAA